MSGDAMLFVQDFVLPETSPVAESAREGYFAKTNENHRAAGMLTQQYTTKRRQVPAGKRDDTWLRDHTACSEGRTLNVRHR